MGNFSAKVDKFIEIFIDQKRLCKSGKVCRTQSFIAIVGLVIGILIGTVIATARCCRNIKCSQEF